MAKVTRSGQSKELPAGRALQQAALDAISELVGEVLRENTAMLQMCWALGLTISVDPQDPGLVRVTKVLQPEEAPAG
jgi:acetyltransferase